MNMLSDRINKMSESATLAMARLSRELKEQGKDVITLSLGEPDFDTPDFIKNAAKKAVDDNFSHYTPVPGLPDLRDSIVKKFQRDNDLSYSRDQIVVSTGAKQSLANVCLSLLNPGDEVLLPCPYWVSYSDLIKLAEAKPVKILSSIDNILVPFGPLIVKFEPSILIEDSLGISIFFFPILDIKKPYKLFLHQHYFF